MSGGRWLDPAGAAVGDLLLASVLPDLLECLQKNEMYYIFLHCVCLCIRKNIQFCSVFDTTITIFPQNAIHPDLAIIT